jgi:amino acid adenylation domain-containing protein/FkbH-like protein
MAPIVVSATFAADPLRPLLQFWARTLGFDVDIALAPYAQVMQELLNPQSLSSRNTTGYNVLLIRPEDWIRDRLSHDTTEQNIAHARKCAQELVAAVEAHRGITSAALLVFICPGSASMPGAYVAPLCELQNDLIDSLAKLANVHCFSHADLIRLYPLSEHEDPWADRLGHIPYTDEYFAALATLLARRIAVLSKPPYKVIVLDCDDTLWKGICGEVGASGIELTAAHLQFQELLVRQHDAGVLLCLCSKNNAADVDEVFGAHPEMPLRRDHLVASRVNWASKSSNLQALARELNLSLDSFIFIDDNARECAEVQAHCPAVLTLQFPLSPREIEHFIAHVWAFDRVGATEEARRRTEAYKANRARDVALQEAGGLEKFLESLELHVEVAAMQAGQVARVAELVQRTNQFNLTGMRRGRGEIEALWKTGELRSLVVNVRDRFGDHGLVGAVLWRESSRAVEVDTFVMSCRVLGLGVEQRVVKELAGIARQQMLTHLVLKYKKTSRNQPAWNFLKELGAGDELPTDSVLTISVDHALTVRRSIAAARAVVAELRPADSRHAAESKHHSEWHAAAYRLSKMPDLLQALRASQETTPRLRRDYVAPRTFVEAAVAEIWAEVLSVERVGVSDDFFELGGDSLQAVRALARIRARLGLELSLGEFFEQATVESVAARLAHAPAADVPIGSVDGADSAPLSSAQLRLWLIDQLEGGSKAYHICEALRLRGDLDQRALQRSLDDLLQRHAALRTVFRKEGTEPLQGITSEASFALQAVDLESFGAERGETEAARHIQDDAAAPFDLTSGPLIRGRLLRLSPHDHVLVVTLHHIIADGWSVGVLMRELGMLYSAHREQRRASLPQVALRYLDYAIWQRGALSDARARERLNYWRESLRDAPERLDLPTDRPRPQVQSYRGASVSLSLGSALTEGLQEFSRKFDATLAMSLYTAWVILLARLSGQSDIVVGMPVANRPRAELEGLIGFFVNTLAVRVSVNPDTTVSGLVERVRTTMLGAYEHQDVPFDQVVEELRPSRSLSHGTLFQVMFTLQNTPRSALEFSGLTVVEQEVAPQTAQYDLTLMLRESAAGVIGSIYYATDLFERTTIERWVGLFKTVLTQMLRAPEEQVGRLALISEAERRHLIEICNDTRAAYPHDQSVQQLFEEQARRSPGAVAVVHGDEVLTYGSLNARANQLARYLIERGMQIGERVPVLMPRGAQIVIAQLAVLKAGAVYVPLDLDMPVERKAFMIRDCGARRVLADHQRPVELDDLKLQWIDCREAAGIIEGCCAENLTLSLLPHHPAYVMYTSGSTGVPKGVCVPHQAINRLVINNGYAQIEATDCIANCSNPAFDASTFEIWGALLNGARLRVINQPVLLEPERFAAALVNGAVTTLFLTTALFNRYAAVIPEALASLKYLLFGGEVSDPRIVRRLLQVGRPEHLLHVYGPTESTTFATSFQVEAVDEGRTNLPIGRPIANTQVYILDSHHQPVPMGVAGEIYIGGAGVALGYVNRPELTAERFLSDPFTSDPQARMYRTGDLGRWRSDGQIEFLGRSDGQVKIRGFRIELGEIESHLARHPGVHVAVVVVREDVPGEKRLVAYIKGVSAAAASAEELRAHLQAVLPPYMLPSAFVMLEQLPLTANGKLDRRALLAPPLEAYVRHEYATPQGEVEQVLAQIWQELLGVQRVGRQDNFFELGGHSLLIVQMLERLRQVGLSAPVRRVFESPHLSDLAGAVLQGEKESWEAPPNLIPVDCEAITPQMLPLVELEMEHIERIVRRVPGGVGNIQDIYPLAPLQEGILFHHLLGTGSDGSRPAEAAPLAAVAKRMQEKGLQTSANELDERASDTYVVPILLSVSSREQLDQLLTAFQGVIDRHDILRTAVLWEELPRAVQVVYRRASLPVEEITLDAEADVAEQLQEWMRLDRQRMDLRQAPLLRLRIAADPHGPKWYVRLQLHHIVGDNTAQEIVTSEVVAHLEGRSQLLPASMPYRRHVAQALAYARTHDAETFFGSKLAEIDEPTAPFGLLDVHGNGAEIEEAQEKVEAELTQRIRAQARRCAVSVATLFHAAWALVIAHTSGRDDVVFGTVLLGRLQGSAGAQRILGMFINTLPLRLRLRDITAQELVARTQSELAELLTHEQASLASAQRASGLGSAPLFCTLLNYRHRLVDLGSVLARVPGVQMLGRVDRTNYPITLSIDDFDGHFALTAHTDRRIDPRRVTAYLQTALHSLVEALEQASQTTAMRLSILPRSEWLQLTYSSNATQPPRARDRLVQELFEQQVERLPDAVAILGRGQVLSYGELNARANQLAHYLRYKGVRPGKFVGLHVEAGLDSVVGLLGILKAGGACLPLDPACSAETLRAGLTCTAACVVLTQQALKQWLTTTGAEISVLDYDCKEIAQQPRTNLSAEISGLRPDHPACVSFTSENADEPLGVAHEHRALVSRLLWMQSEYPLSSEDRVLQSGSYDCDTVLRTVISGACLGTGALQTVDAVGITELHITLPLLQQFLDQREANRRTSLRRVICSGELRYTSAQRRFFASFRHSQLLSLYGKPEVAIGAAVREWRPEDQDARTLIGRLIANTRIYVLDSYRQPVPMGVAGDIYVGGAGLALTAERFPSDPFTSDPQARMYRTGDLGRWRSDGQIEFLGRSDGQVKIRGFRIELGEIESHLARHPRVREAVVCVREDAPGEKRLVAYIKGVSAGATNADAVSATAVSTNAVRADAMSADAATADAISASVVCKNLVSAEELRTHLQAVLPPYMLPSAFVMLEQLPLTADGKLDRCALPAPPPEAYVRHEYAAPQGEVEQVLAQIWQELLGVQRVGRQDNFFELGGHSLLIVQMVERLRRVGLSVQVRRVFESPHLLDLADVLLQGEEESWEAPPNLIPVDCEAITPQMLPLVELEVEHIERIVRCVPGGVGNIQDIYPLAPLQEGILFHHLLDERGGDIYAVPILLSVPSREQLEQLVAAFQGVIDRHDILRTAVLWEELPRAVQVVYRRARVPVEEITLDAEVDVAEQLKEWMRLAHQRMDLRQAPLLRLRIAADPHSPQWYVIIQTHHLSLDHVSLEAVIAELLAHLEGHAHLLPASVPYRQHVAQALAYARTHDAESFFGSKLAEIDEPTAPFGLLDVHGDGAEIEEAHEKVEAELTQRIRTQARRCAVSMATLFHAAWALVVAHTSGRDDVVFGTVLLGRQQSNASVQGSLGIFMNTLPLRLRLSEVSCRELVEQTRRELAELLNHEQASLAVAQRCSAISGSAPLFTALLNYRHTTGQGLDSINRTGMRILAAQERTNYPLTLSVDDFGEDLALKVQADQRIDPRRILSYVRTAMHSLLGALEHTPHAPALMSTILPESERHQVVEVFNATRAPYSKNKQVHELFEAQAERTPLAVAVLHAERSCTYAELNARANQLARYLRAQGVGSNQRVGICVERSPEMLIGLLGTLKAGAAYVPLDPTYPSARLRHMLEDSAPTVLLTQARLKERLQFAAAECVALDAQAREIASFSEENLSPAELGLTAQDAVYVIYTSGSTGQPKGTIMPHSAMVNLIEWHRSRFPAGEGKRVLQFAALSFDVAFQEIFSTLCTGGTLVLLDEWVRRDSRALLELLCTRSIERLFVPPLVLQSLAECAEAVNLSPRSIQDVIVAGEQLRLSAEISGFFKQLGTARLHNHYGPTETHVVTAQTLTGNPDAWPGFPPIGSPISNARLYVLNEHLRVLPIGVAGEIYVGGVCVAHGYVQRPELTQQRFIPDPFSANPNARLYKTGDLARWRVDGALDYLGRKDDQVKIRGYRIELGEIEAHLAQHEQIKDAAVVAREDTSGIKRLIAYVTQHGENELDIGNVRAHLASSLPEYMIPTAIVILDSLPLSPNGKLNRRDLQARELTQFGGSPHDPPQGEVEETLAWIWQELLHVDQVSRDDNFFELGGHSLHGMRLGAKVAKLLGVHLPAVAIFKYPTVRQMAELVKAAQPQDEKLGFQEEVLWAL